jgi:hypothetical protein
MQSLSRGFKPATITQRMRRHWISLILRQPLFATNKMGDGWLERSYRHIKSAISRVGYSGPHKWWAPNDNSTFTPVPDAELPLFEEHILKPYFGIALVKFDIT